jgi:hypothetical protein
MYECRLLTQLSQLGSEYSFLAGMKAKKLRDFKG